MLQVVKICLYNNIDSDEFLNKLDSISNTPSNLKGDYFFELGNILFEEGFSTSKNAVFAAESYFNYGFASFERALKYYIQNKNKCGEALSCFTIGFFYGKRGAVDKSIEYLIKALDISKEIGYIKIELESNRFLGVAYNEKFEQSKSFEYYIKAVEYYKRSIDIANENGYNEEASLSISKLTFLYECLLGKDSETIINDLSTTFKDPDEFVDKVEQLFFIFPEKGNLLRFIGDVLSRYSKPHLALKLYLRALNYFIKSDDRGAVANCYGKIGAAYKQLTDFYNAIEYYKKALSLAEGTEDKKEEARCYGDLAQVYYELTDFYNAIEYYKKALSLAEGTEDKKEEAICYRELGIVYHVLGFLPLAINYFFQALKIIIKMLENVPKESIYYNEIKFEKSICLMEIGIAYFDYGASLNDTLHYNTSICYLNNALTISQEREDLVGISMCYMNLARVYYALCDPNKSINLYDKALTLVQHIEDIDLERKVRFLLYDFYSEREPKVAYEHLKRSIDLSEVISERLVEEPYKIGYYGRTTDRYYSMIALCIRLNNKEEAFSYVERSRSRAFIAMLATTKIRPTVKLTDELRSLLEMEEQYLVELRKLQTRHLRNQNTTMDLGKRDSILQDLKQVYRKISNIDLEYVHMRGGRTTSFDEIRQIV